MCLYAQAGAQGPHTKACDINALQKVIKGELSPKIKCGLYDRASPETYFGVSLVYVRSLEGS